MERRQFLDEKKNYKEGTATDGTDHPSFKSRIQYGVSVLSAF